jgi:hypothetical protein
MLLTRTLPFLAALALAAAGCDAGNASAASASAAPTVAPTSSAVVPAKPASMDAKKLAVDKATSKVDFLMEAPEEKIHGRADAAMTGELAIDFGDLTKSTGAVTVDIGDLVLTQARVDKAGKISEEKKVDKQNEHARTWLEISPDTPEEIRAKNRLVRFVIQSVEVAGEKDLAKLSGPERKVMLKASGTFQLHGHDTQKTAELEATFRFEGDRPVCVTVKTVKPLAVGLVEHDVKPRDAFGKFALKTLDTLSGKVAKEALVSFEYTAKVGP